MMPKFFLNYGGPGGSWLTENPETAAKLDQTCQKEYLGAKRAIGAIINGIQVTVHTYGIHRCVSCEIPDGPNIPPGTDLSFQRKLEVSYDVLQQRYAKLLWEAYRFSEQGYNLLNHNCVTGTAHVLHTLDPHLTPEGMVSPWSLDAELEKYCGDNSQDPIMNRFFDKYQTKMRSGFFSFMHISSWSMGMGSDDKTTLDDIIKHSYGRGVEGSGERTKSTLIDLKWVKEDKDKGLLVPTARAPQDFREKLNDYNADFVKVERLKALYTEHASIFSFNKHHFFDDNPDFKTAKARLEAQVARNPHGASFNALKQFSKEEAIRAQKESAPPPRDLESFKAVLMAEREAQRTPEFPPPAITPLIDDATPTVSQDRFKETMQAERASQSPPPLTGDIPGPDKELTLGLSA